MNKLNQTIKALIISVLLIIIAGGLLFFTVNNVNATKQSTPPPATPNAEALADLHNQDENSGLSESISLPQQEATPAVNPGSESTVVSTLSETARNYLHAGWLHFVKENTSDTDRGSKGMLDDGSVLSANTIWECWLHLDDMLQITDSVCIQTNPDGSIIQVGVRAGNITWNSATDEVVYNKDASSPYIPEIDTLPSQTAKSNVSLEVKGITDELGKERYQLSYATTESSPVMLWDYNNPVIGFHYIFTFDPDTGMLVNSQRLVSFEDGSQRMIEQVSISIFEILETPPEAIVNYLSQLESR